MIIKRTMFICTWFTAFWLLPSNGWRLKLFQAMKLRQSLMSILSWFAKHSTLAEKSQDECCQLGIVGLIALTWRVCVFSSKLDPGSGQNIFVDNDHNKHHRKDYWCAEAYARVTFLIGKMHLIQSFAYWLPIHNIGELGLVWGAVVCASSLSAAVWIMFRMDVLPSHGGVFPIEIGGPIIEAISLALAYTHHPTPGVLDISRTLVI